MAYHPLEAYCPCYLFTVAVA